MKAGIKTTEFALSLLAAAVVNVQAYLTEGSPTERIVALVGTILVALGYVGSRTRIKTSEPAAPPAP